MRKVNKEWCRKCGIRFTYDDISKYSYIHRDYICKDCLNKRNKLWRSKNRQHFNEVERIRYRRNHDEIRKKKSEYTRNYFLRLRIEVFSHYSPELKCQNSTCEVPNGTKDIRSLSMDHINGGGNEHRRKIGGGGSVLWNWLKKHNYPEGFQVLCFNCQWIKALERNEVFRNKH